MSLANDASDSSFRSNGKRTNGNGGLNNNRDEYKMDMKTNGIDKVAEEDPLTGRRQWEVLNTTKEPKWSQRFASTNFFMLIFLLAYVLQGDFSHSTYNFHVIITNHFHL